MTNDEFMNQPERLDGKGGGEARGSCFLGHPGGEFWNGRGYGCGECDDGAGGGTVLGTGLGYGCGSREMDIRLNPGQAGRRRKSS